MTQQPGTPSPGTAGSTRRPSTNVINSVYYSVGNYAFQVASAVTTIIASRLLGPQLAGVIAYLNAFDQYVGLLCSPVRSAVETQVPVLSGSPIQRQQFVESAFGVHTVYSFVGAAVFLVIASLSSNPAIRIGAASLAVISIVRGVGDFLRIYEKALLRFRVVSLSLVVLAVFQPLLVIGMTVTHGYDGFWIGRFGVFALGAAVLAGVAEHRIRVLLRWDRHVLKVVYGVGLPMVIYGIMTVALTTIDKILIRYVLNLTELGYYSIGTMIFQGMLLLPTSVFGSYFPRFMTVEPTRALWVTRTLTKIVALVLCCFIVVTWLAIPLLIQVLLPAFGPAEWPAKILLVAMYFAGVNQMYYYSLVRRGEFRGLLLWGMLILLAAVTSYYLTLRWGAGLIGVAAITALAFGTMVIATSTLAQSSFLKGIRSTGALVAYVSPIVLLGVVDLATSSQSRVYTFVVGTLVMVVYVAMLIRFAARSDVRPFLLRSASQ